MSFTRNSNQQFNDKEQKLDIANLTENNFVLDDENSEWLKSCSATYKANQTQTESDQPLLTKLEKLMPHWTPEGSDKVVYATVTEAYSGSVDDVSSYLLELRRDLHIGEGDYPKYILVGGDQQTYAIMKNKYPDQYDWLYPIPGDWHIMKTAADVIKNVLYDGGFKVLLPNVATKVTLASGRISTMYLSQHMKLVFNQSQKNT